MEIVEQSEPVVISVSASDLTLMAAAMNEALEIEDWEFPIRVGVEKDVMLRLLEKLNKVIDDLGTSDR